MIADPAIAFALDFDHLFQAWDDPTQPRNIRDNQEEDEEADASDDEFDPTKKRSKKNPKTKARSSSMVENPRQGLHTLNENHGYLFSSSFDAPVGNVGGLVPSSSQYGGFGFDDNFIEPLDEIGDELARELGEGWGASPGKHMNQTHVDPEGLDIEMGGMGDMGEAFEFGGPGFGGEGFAADNVDAFPAGQASPVHSRINEERSRKNYIEGQAQLKREIERRNAEKESARRIDEMIWGAPRGVNAPVLVDFWLENFRLQVEARCGQLCLDTQGLPPRKRRRLGDEEDEVVLVEDGKLYGFGEGIDERVDIDFGLDGTAGNFDTFQDNSNFQLETRMRSSEEPGQARHASRPPSSLGRYFNDLEPQPAQDFNVSASQRSNLFPWDHAGASSSVTGVAFGAGASDRVSLGSRKRASSVRESPFRIAGSPASFGLRSSQAGLGADAFEFQDVAEDPAALESQQSDASVLTLERNSFNFME
ncbi:hypothetical protein PHLCEN_2v456 [Hermanssonia centrifuga]|uniref:Uncharacterized protein n=1 Tax=Hermanssonia centrifuga TaxID=98765 RepID=A0A2R6S699_9APHY|nr:hypothetical protein PHLCEN_2v456 [Hermanssonia centrifuga]